MTYKENPLSQTGNRQRAALQGAFVVIPEISHSDISYILKNPAHTKHAGYGKMIV